MQRNSPNEQKQGYPMSVLSKNLASPVIRQTKKAMSNHQPNKELPNQQKHGHPMIRQTKKKKACRIIGQTKKATPDHQQSKTFAKTAKKSRYPIIGQTGKKGHT